MQEVKLINLVCGHSIPKKKENKGVHGVWWCKNCKKYVKEKIIEMCNDQNKILKNEK